MLRESKVNVHSNLYLGNLYSESVSSSSLIGMHVYGRHLDFILVRNNLAELAVDSRTSVCMETLYWNSDGYRWSGINKIRVDIKEIHCALWKY